MVSVLSPDAHPPPCTQITTGAFFGPAAGAYMSSVCFGSLEPAYGKSRRTMGWAEAAQAAKNNEARRKDFIADARAEIQPRPCRCAPARLPTNSSCDRHRDRSSGG